MAWQIDLTDSAKKQLCKLDRATAKRITTFLRERVAGSGNPRNSVKALTGLLGGLSRYRVGDYRIACDIQDHALCALVLIVGNRSDVYR
ncbi:MAG: type II toxin-antitoxin system RelE/ParE family toxin [Rhodanobacter sp.]